MSDGLRPSVSARRGWVWVAVGGTGVALLVTYPAIGPTVAGWLWWLVAAVAGLVWEAAWWVPGAVAALLLLAAVGVAVWVWLGRRR